ncbi:MAG: discoidin domain-containing protein [Clostridia bacterium]|nr:discoidin domain-containing protein [Clostridia bacterium]
MKKHLSILLTFALCIGLLSGVSSFSLQTEAASADSSEWVAASPKTPTVTAMEQSDLLDELMAQYTTFVVVRHRQLGGSHYAYSEALSDTAIEADSSPNPEEVSYRVGAELVLVELENKNGQATRTETVLLSDGDGVLRDPDVSEDGTKVLFSWSKAKQTDDFHLYEYDLLTDKYRQLTFGVGVADTEPKYMPNGDIIFSSTRMTQVIDCFYAPVSNLYRCGPDGENIVRVGYDQVHTTYPTLTDDGRVLYTRWDYNDRTQIYTQAIFQMFPDGTNQTEVYGNNTNFPPSLLHTRQVVGTTDQYISIASGHHTYQAGKLCIVDTSKGRNADTPDNDTITFLVGKDEQDELPYIQSADDEYHDRYGQWGFVYKYPYSITKDTFLVSGADIGYANGSSYEAEKTGWGNAGWGNSGAFKIYIMNTAGDRVELVGMSGSIGASQIVPVAKRTLFERASMVNYTSSTGTYYIGNVYEGEGLKDVPVGTAKYLRVVALDYRAYTVGNVGVSDTRLDSTNSGQAYGAVSVGNGAWDVKRVLGIVPIEEDGSALFSVPSETPVYFQVLDENGCMIQSMRSWSTLMPGEVFSCVGCHEDKNTVPPAMSTVTMAMAKGVQKLQPDFWQDADYDPYTESTGFSYLKEIQPILNDSCVQCHNDVTASKRTAGISGLSSIDEIPSAAATNSNSNTDETVIFPIESEWQYVIDEAPANNWYTDTFDDSAWATGQGLFGDLGTANTHWDGDGSYIWLRKEFTLTAQQIAALSGRQLFLNIYYDESPVIYLNNEQIFTASGSLSAYETRDLKLSTTALLREGKNVIAVRADNVGKWGQRIDVGLSAKAYSGTEFSLQSFRFGVEANENSAFVGKAFPLSYLVLTGSNGTNFNNSTASTSLLNWIHTMTDAEMREPYSAGSSKSKLITMLRNKHSGVVLTEAEIRAFEAWIDLGVPCMGSYDENNMWTSNQMRWAEESQNKRDFYTTLNELARTARATGKTAPSIGITYKTAGGTVYDDTYAFATTTRLEIPVAYTANDTLTVTLPDGEHYLGLTLNSRMGETIVYVPGGTYTFTVPSHTLTETYTPTFSKNTFNTITARIIGTEELTKRHNLSVNPYDTTTNTTAYPHAVAGGTGTAVTDQPRNAIDGVSSNKGYGAYPNHSWSAADSGNSWLQIDFGREVIVDEVLLKIRAGFDDSHDTYWKSGVLEFSDGSTEPITIDSTADAQTFTLDAPRTTTYVKLNNLVKVDASNSFVGLSEIAVYGTENKSAPKPAPQVVYTSGSATYADPTVSQNGSATLTVPKAYTAGDTVTVTLPQGETYLGITLNDKMGEAILYVPSGTYTYTVPSASVMTAAMEPTFSSNTTNPVKVRVVGNEELSWRRNLAFNPYDTDTAEGAYPHASASDWHATNAMFAPRNTIDGVTQNESHNAWPYQSWGPSATGEHWMMIDFGHATTVSEIAVYLRSDQSSGHTLYKSATLEFSDGSTQAITFDATLDKQTITFDPVVTSYVKLTELVKVDESMTWAGITEFEVYGSGEKPPFKRGDVNNDGTIDTADGLLLLRYLNDWDVTVPQPEAMDVNSDGAVDAADGLLLMRYLNGWDVSLSGSTS